MVSILKVHSAVRKKVYFELSRMILPKKFVLIEERGRERNLGVSTIFSVYKTILGSESLGLL